MQNDAQFIPYVKQEFFQFLSYLLSHYTEKVNTWAKFGEHKATILNSY